MSYYSHLAAALIIPAIATGVWIAKNKGRWFDTYNLLFRKARCVKVNFHTASGRNIERFIVPDSRGFMRINGGVYKFHKEFAEINQRYRIPEVDVLESQITPPQASLGVDESDTEVDVAQPDGTVIKMKRKVPTYYRSFRREIPQKTNDLWAHEVAAFADSHIVMDITTATAQVLRQLQWTFYLSIATLVIMTIGLYMLNGNIDAITLRLDTLITGLSNRGGV